VITDQMERVPSRTERSRPAGLPRTPSKRWFKALAFVPLLAIALLQLVLFFKIHAREQVLAERGVTTSATVVGTDYHGDTDYLRVRLPECGCVVEVGTADVEGHPVGTSLPVRYDPQRPGRAEALVDRPNPYEGVLTMSAGLGLGVAILVPLVWVARRRRRQALRLVGSTAPTLQVRVEAWERTLNNTPIYYLSVYPAGSGSGTRPLLCLPVDGKILNQIPPATTLELFGTPEPGNVIALRTGDLVITPAGRTKSPAFEDAKRSAHATISLTGTADDQDEDPTPVPAVDGPLLRDAREARLWRRTNRIFGWLVPVMLLLPAVRILPDRLMWWGLGVLFAALAIEFAVLGVRRRLLARLSDRLPGPPPVGRRDRRAARRAAEGHLAGPAGLGEQAALLGVPIEALEADRKRAGRRLVAAMAVGGVGFLALMVYVVTA
jgi:hypothetical protein